MPGFADCDLDAATGCEQNIATDANHCGSCTNICIFPNATAGCVGGGCTLGACASGFGNCDGNAANGCETSLMTSNTNCGACGTRCVGSHVCLNGSCT
jgi:hypothetical protein